MNSRNSLISPTLWLATGMGLVVGLVCLLLEGGTGFGEGLLKAYEGRGFPEMEVIRSSSPVSLLAMVVFVFGIVLALEGTPGTGRRVMLLVSGLVILAMASPIFALWGIFWNPFVLLISVFWAGVGASVQGSNRDRVEALRIVNEQNVVQMNSPVSPNKRRKG